MRRLFPLLTLAACGTPVLGTPYWLTADGAGSDIGAACVAAPLHDTHAFARLVSGEDDRWLDMDGVTYRADPDAYTFTASLVDNSGAGLVSTLSLTPEGRSLVGEVRTDDTTVSGTTCAIETPVTLEPVTASLGVWELTGNGGEGIVEPEGCRGSLGDAPFHLLAEAWSLRDGRVGLWLSPDPIQRRARWMAGDESGGALEVSWGGAFDNVVEESRMTVSIDDANGTLTWQQGSCSLTLSMLAVQR